MDRRFMALALSMGRRGMGKCWPNPAVGCVIVRDGVIVGRGWTQPGGRPHAEVVALAQAGEAARGATAYVTLEPCAHTGKTGPCAEALVTAGVARVVSAMTDPDPRVAGQGHAILERAGVSVTVGVRGDEAAADHWGFLQNRVEGRPFVTLKLANSFDGRIATATGESQWITGPEARHLVHAMRDCHDAVMVGGGTARADDPQLTVRGFGARAQPLRVICARRLDLPLSGRLIATAAEVPTVICHGDDAPSELRDAWAGAGARLVPVAVAPGGHLDVVAVLAELGTLGVTRVFCEGGGGLAASLLNAGLVDQLIGFTAGVALGAEGRPSLGAMGVDRLAEAPRFDLIRTAQIGADVLHVWQRPNPFLGD
jgi:diaminohydroxyphosphoribosylaminopyrimidine deaminase/5-amino-6-(5-phosphoribosylamino)uracil reductase